jgi:TRAP transporter 4TM/12TM fusion protein
MSQQPDPQPQGEVEVGEAAAVTRVATGWTQKAIYGLGIAMSVFHIWVNTIGVMPGIYRNASHLGFVLAMTFLIYPWSKRRPGSGLRTDYVLACMGVAVAVYILLFEEELHLERGSVAILRDYIFAGIAIVLLLEATRRTTGILIPTLAVLFMLYATVLGKYIPGVFNYRGFLVTRLLYRMYLTDEGIFGLVATVSSTYVVLFIIFGAFLLKSGAGDFLIDLARALTGRRVGGPAKIAVVASGLFGSISGSAVANVVGTGAFTIPMMKRVGYKPHVAGAIEAAASTGGQVMPPVMGAGAFIMAQWTGISYLYIIAVSVIPAVMYYLSVAFFVHIEALKTGIQPLREEEIPRIGDVMKRGFHFLIPVALLVLLLVRGFTPTYAACWGILTIVVVSWFRKDTRMGPRKILDALYMGGRNTVSTGTILMCAGIIIGVVAITGLAITFSGMVLDLSGGMLLPAMFLVLGASLVLGMGLPVTAAYIMLAVLAVPALIDMKVPVLAAHLIVFYFSQFANVTPPICLAAFAGAGIANASPMKTGFYSWRAAKGLYLLPFLFAYTHILFTGPVHSALITAVTSTLGLYCFTAAFQGYVRRPIGLLIRLLLGGSAIALILENYPLNGLGLAVLGAIYFWQKFREGRKVSLPEPG